MFKVYSKYYLYYHLFIIIKFHRREREKIIIIFLNSLIIIKKSLKTYHMIVSRRPLVTPEVLDVHISHSNLRKHLF